MSGWRQGPPLEKGHWLIKGDRELFTQHVGGMIYTGVYNAHMPLSEALDILDAASDVSVETHPNSPDNVDKTVSTSEQVATAKPNTSRLTFYACRQQWMCGGQSETCERALSKTNRGGEWWCERIGMPSTMVEKAVTLDADENRAEALDNAPQAVVL